jgi:hypothetical protein
MDRLKIDHPKGPYAQVISPRRNCLEQHKAPSYLIDDCKVPFELTADYKSQSLVQGISKSDDLVTEGRTSGSASDALGIAVYHIPLQRGIC